MSLKQKTFSVVRWIAFAMLSKAVLIATQFLGVFSE